MPIQSLTSLNIFLHSVVSLCSATRALLPCNIIFYIFFCSFWGYYSTSCWAYCNYAFIYSTWVMSCIHSPCSNLIWCSGSPTSPTLGNSGATFWIFSQASTSLSCTLSSLHLRWIFPCTSCALHVCATNPSFLTTSTEFSTSWILFSNWSFDALISPNKCFDGHCTKSADEGATSMGARVCSGSALAIECFEWVYTSSSLDGPGTILNLSTEGKRFRTSIMAMHSFINYAHYWGFWRTPSIYSHSDFALCPGVAFGSFWAFGISWSFVASAPCIVLYWAPSPLVDEVICWLLWACDSSTIWVSFSCAEGSVCCS